MFQQLRAYLRAFRANHRAFGNVSEDLDPRYSAVDRAHGLRHADECHSHEQRDCALCNGADA